MPYSSVAAAKAGNFNTTLNGVTLTLAQINSIAAAYDAIKAKGGAEEPMAVAVAQFKASHKKVGDKWVVKESEGIKYFDGEIREAAIIEAVEVVNFVIREAEDGGKFLEATLIAPGFSKNTVRSKRGKTYQRHYGNGILRETAPKLDGLEIYIGYDEHNDKLDYPKEFGVWEGSHFEEGQGIRGDIHVYPDQYWVLDRFKVNPNTLKLSIEGNGGYRYGVLEGKPTADVVALDVSRARLVKRPAAGGEITGIRESQQGGEDMEGLTLSELKESHRDVAEAFKKEILESAENAAAGKAKDDRIKELVEAAEKDKAKYAELGTKLNEAKGAELIEAAFPEDLPDVAKTKLRESLKKEAEGLDLTDDKDQKVYAAKIAESVKGEADYIATLAEAGKVKGMGGGAPDKRKAFVESATKDMLAMAGVPLDEAEDKK